LFDELRGHRRERYRVGVKRQYGALARIAPLPPFCLVSFSPSRHPSFWDERRTTKTTETASAELQLNKSMAELAGDNPNMDQISCIDWCFHSGGSPSTELPTWNGNL
jgi:hypothetical protein